MPVYKFLLVILSKHFLSYKKNRKTYWFLWLSSVGLPIYICQHNCSLTDFIELILLWIFQNKRWKKVKKKTRLCKLTLRGGKMKKKRRNKHSFCKTEKKKQQLSIFGLNAVALFFLLNCCSSDYSRFSFVLLNMNPYKLVFEFG